MNAVVNESRENLAEFRAPGPGERLKAARVSLGLEPAKVAAQLHLSTDMVHAIERDDYSAMPARVFVRGYIKNYSRVVGLPAEGLLKQLEERFPDEVATNGLNRVGTDIRRELRSSHGIVRLMTWVIVLGLGVLFVLWWRGHLDWRSQIDNGAAAVAEDQAETMALPGGDGMLALPGVYADESLGRLNRDRVPESALPPSSETSPDRGRAIEEVAGVATEPGAAPGVDSTLGSESELGSRSAVLAGSDAQTLTETATTAASGALIVGEPRSSTAEAASPPATIDSAPAAGASRVVIEFSAPCWVDIRDSAGRFKLYGEMAAGRKETLGGVPPYKLTIGNATAARLSIDGKPFDLATHTSGNVARFTLTTN